jgi:hypothetical protein
MRIKKAILKLHRGQWAGGGSGLGFKAHRMVRGLAGGAALLLATVLVAGCTPPRYTYITDSNDSMYFKVPYGWQQIGSSELCTVLAEAAGAKTCPSNWHTAYEADSDPSAFDFLAFATSSPFVYAMAEPYTPPDGQSVNQDPLTAEDLQDLYLPFTAEAQAEAQEQAEEQGQQYPLTHFKQLRSDQLTLQGGFTGFRQTFDYTDSPTGVSDTFDEVILTNSSGSTIYLLVTHCTTSCYSQHETAINDVMSSFTVRS